MIAFQIPIGCLELWNDIMEKKPFPNGSVKSCGLMEVFTSPLFDLQRFTWWMS